MLPEDQPATDPMDDLMNYAPSSYNNEPDNNSGEDEEAPTESGQNIVVDIADILQYTWQSAHFH